MMRTATRAAFAGVLSLALAACGGGGGSSSPKTYASAADLAKAAGCTGYAKQDTQIFTQETGQCTIDGQTIYVMTFADQASRDGWMAAAKTAGATGYFGEGATWVLQGDDNNAVVKGTQAAGGEIK